ncbi:(2Fe-2S)-binding protein [Streptomyces sp. 5-6(2022)]|uniref:(2Fe-2S)-binding protein n=1 Tax=Streptomyces sp. 5-6(2022) TaxID=2936510 RepID=UPI0031BB054E
MSHAGSEERTGSLPYRLTFDGTTVTARPGQSVGAALVAAGIVAWRTTRREGRPRGLFCGIGVCFDCLITVDGRPGQRACLVPARDGMRLSPEDGGDGRGGVEGGGGGGMAGGVEGDGRGGGMTSRVGNGRDGGMAGGVEDDREGDGSDGD